MKINKKKFTLCFALGIVLLSLCCVNIVNAQDIITDNGDSGTSYTGTWLVSGGENPYGTDSLWSRDGATYTWHADLPQTGVYEVYMWWTNYSNRGDSAPVTIEYDGGSQVVYVNQTRNGGTWNHLSTYSFDAVTGGTVTITAGISPDTYCADAVKFVYAPGANIPPIATIESISPNPAPTGEEVFFVGNGTDSDGTVVNYSWRSSIDGELNDSASFNTSTLSEGTHTIFFKVQDNEGVWSQEVSETLIIGVTPTEIIIDNGDSGTSYTGVWQVSGGENPYGTDSLWSRDGATYTWHADLPQTGVYEVYMWWTNYSNRGDSAPVTIEYDGGSQVVYVNQTRNGGTWNHLSTYSFDAVTGGTVTITAGISPDTYCADAVKFVYAPGANIPPIATIESISPNPAPTGEEVFFVGNGTDSDGTVVNYSWRSSIDGELNDSASFNTSTLSEGTHTIFFKVQDNEGVWSQEVSETLIIGVTPTEIIIDNGDSGTSYTGVWQVSGGENPYGTDSLWSRDGATYTWHADLPQTGVYEVYMWWTNYSNRGDSAPVTIEYDGGSQVVYVNQTRNGGTWNHLSTYSFDAVTGGTVTITAGISPDTYCADAVKFVYAPGANIPPIATIESISPNPAPTGEEVFFVGNGTDSDGTVVNYSWRSSIDGELNDSASFNTSTLSEGTHTIFFKVQDNEGVWSQEVSETLIIGVTPTEIIIDNGDSGTSYTGVWQVSGGENPYGTDSLWSRDGATYTWHADLPQTGVYEVYMWWTNYSNRGDSAPVTIEYDGGSQVVYVNQTRNGGMWNHLSTYSFDAVTGGTVTITAGISPDTYCADAVKFVYAPDANIPPIVTIESISPNPAPTGEKVFFVGNGTDSDGIVVNYSWRSSLDGDLNNSALFNTSTLSEGTHTIFLKVQDNEGVWSLEVSETLIIGESSIEIIIDNGDAGTSYTGTWGVSGGVNPYGNDSLYCYGRNGANYTWHADPPQTGVYEVYMWWTNLSSRSTSAPVTIEYDSGSHVVYVNQQQNGGTWNYLSTYSFNEATGGTVTITADISPDNYCADAVKFVYVPGANIPPIATIESISPNPAQPGETVTFAGNGTDSDGTVDNYSWNSSLDGVLSNSASFNISTLSEGTHTIFLKVQDNEETWSLEVSEELLIGEPPNVVVCYGDSITYSLDLSDVGIYPDTLKESLSNYYNEPQEVINEGYGGWTSYDGSAYVNTIIDKYPGMEQVCLMFGTNDASYGTPLSDYKSNMGYMIGAFQNEGINVILGILPPVSEVREFQHDRALILNEILRELALEKKVYIADTSFYFNDTWSSIYFQDELHPNSVGYEIIGNTSFFLPIVDSHRLHNGYNLLSTNTIVANDSVEEINVTATTWDKGRVNTTVTTYNSTQFTFVANGTTNITINMSDGLFDIYPSTEYYVYRDGFCYINSSTLDGYLLFTVPLGGIHTVDVFDTYHTPRPNITSWHNNKTNDQSLVLYINRSEEVIFNITVDQPVTIYNWVKDGIPDVGDDSFGTSWDTFGVKTVSVNATNANGVTDTITWNIIIENPQEIIIDNGDPGTSYTGTWGVSLGENPYGTDSLWSNDGATYTWHANLSQTGVYEVYMWWTYYSNRGDSVPVTIEYDGGSQVVYVNQAQNGGMWNHLSTYSFDAATGGTVTITAADPYPVSTCADAVKFVYVSDQAAPSILGYAPEEAVVNDTEGAQRTFNITVNQTVNVSWQINGTEVCNQTGVTEGNYTNASAAVGYWNVSAVVENANGTAMHMWLWHVTAYEAPAAPGIIGYAPEEVEVNDTAGAQRTFNITVNQTVNVSWQINGTEVCNQIGVIEGNYTNASAAVGYWNVSAVVENGNGTAMHTWLWNVTAYEAPAAPGIIGYAPEEVEVNDTEGAERTFNITVNQTVNVSWQINGTEVCNQTGVTEGNYTNASAAVGYWNVSAVVENANGTAMHTWLWNVTAYEAPAAPGIIGYAPDDAVVNGTEGAQRTFNITVNQTVTVRDM